MSKKRKKTKIKDPFKKVQVTKDGKAMIDTLLIEGTFFAPSGYGSSTREFTHHFIKKFGDNYKNIFLIDRQWDNIKMMLPPKFDNTIKKYLVTKDNVIQDVIPNNSMILRWGIPTAFEYQGFDEVPHRIKAIYFVWECDRLPPLWVDLLYYYDIIFTSSKASARAIQKSIDERGISIPVEIIPHGVADHYMEIENKVKTLDGFSFMMVGTFSKRKAPMEMMEVFLREFKDSDGVRLIWKIGSVSDPGQMLVLRREIQRMAFRTGVDMSEAPKIILDMNTYDHDLMNVLYNEADCMIQVSHGEAWGLPILNAMATGTPSLVLEKGGQRAFCTKKNSFFVKDAGLIYADGKDDWYAVQNGVRWWKIDMDDYQKQMRYVFDNREEVIAKGQEGKLKAKKFTWNNVVNKAYKVFNKYDNLLISRYERSKTSDN